MKPVLAVLLSLPLVWLAWLVYLDLQNPGTALGADAGETLVHYLGEWALIVLLGAYAVTPLRQWWAVPFLIRSRRMVGLFAFAYVCLHLLSYAWFYLGFDAGALLEDFAERPYIMVGMVAFFCLLLMAVTSTQGWQRRLRRNWKRLHTLMYPTLALALVHLWWLTRDGYGEVLLYTGVFFVLSAARLWSKWATQVRQSA